MLQLDFEGLMKYFRVNIPKRYRSEENAKNLMLVATNIKLKKLKKYEKEYVSLKNAERAREDPAVRFERENKKLLNDNLRLDTENDNLARQLVNSKIEMRKEIDRAEDEKEYYEKEMNSTKAMLAEALDEKKRLEGETEQLKSVLKREVDKLDAELATRNNVIAEYKVITSQLSAKLEKAQKAGTVIAIADEDNVGEGGRANLEAANDRIRELELELAQTKLALVETECKNQDLAHQFNAKDAGNAGASQQPRSGTWFSKTLSSIKETASAHAPATIVKQASSVVASASSQHQQQQQSRDPLKKSTSVDAGLKQDFH